VGYRLWVIGDFIAHIYLFVLDPKSTDILISNICESFEAVKSEFHVLFGDAVSVDNNGRESVFVNLQVVINHEIAQKYFDVLCLNFAGCST